MNLIFQFCFHQAVAMEDYYLKCQNQVGFDKQILSYVYVCLLPSEVSLQLKILPKNIFKNKSREDEIDTIFNSPCLFTWNALIQFKIAHACLRRIFQCMRRVYLHFTYNDIFICYMHSPYLISIIKCHHRHPPWQCPLTAYLRFQQQFVLDATPLPMDLIGFSSHPRLLL